MGGNCWQETGYITHAELQTPLLRDVTFVHRLPNRRRAANLLAGLLVPFVLASVFAGLQVCASSSSVNVSWISGSDCLSQRHQDQASLTSTLTEVPFAADCVVIKGADDAVPAVTSAPPQSPASVAILASASKASPVMTQATGSAHRRGPPATSPHLLRSVVLRI